MLETALRAKDNFFEPFLDEAVHLGWRLCKRPMTAGHFFPAEFWDESLHTSGHFRLQDSVSCARDK